MDEMERPDQLEKKLQKIIKQKTAENKVLKKLLERLECDNPPEKIRKETSNNKDINKS